MICNPGAGDKIDERHAEGGRVEWVVMPRPLRHARPNARHHPPTRLKMKAALSAGRVHAVVRLRLPESMLCLSDDVINFLCVLYHFKAGRGRTPTPSAPPAGIPP